MSSKKCNRIGPVIQCKTFDINYYHNFYRYLVANVPRLVITTADLVSTLHKLQSRFDQERNSVSWRTLTCLGILAQEELIDLSIHYLKQDGSKDIINLTPTGNPYWSIETIEKVFTMEGTIAIVEQYDNKGFRYFARSIANAEQKLLEKAENNWTKEWYVQEPMTREERNKAEDNLDITPDSFLKFPATAEVIPETSFVLVG